MENWTQELDLTCAAPARITLPYMLYFIFFGVGGILTAPVIDRIGRLRSHWLFSTGHLLAQALCIFINNEIAHIIGYSMMGFFMGKNSLIFTWTFEFVTQRSKGCASTFILILDFCTPVIAGMFIMFVSRDWKMFMYPFFAIGALGFVIVSVLMPESPKWLLLQGRQEDAIRSLNFVARVNRSPSRIDQKANFVEAAIAANLDNN